MSAPRTTYDDPLRGMATELISAMSALNMCPLPLPADKISPDSHGYLSEIDGWALHAMEHLHAAFDLLLQVESTARRKEKLVAHRRINPD